MITQLKFLIRIRRLMRCIQSSGTIHIKCLNLAFQRVFNSLKFRSLGMFWTYSLPVLQQFSDSLIRLNMYEWCSYLLWGYNLILDNTNLPQNSHYETVNDFEVYNLIRYCKVLLYLELVGKFIIDRLIQINI